MKITKMEIGDYHKEEGFVEIKFDFNYKLNENGDIIASNMEELQIYVDGLNHTNKEDEVDGILTNISSDSSEDMILKKGNKK